MLNGSLPGFDLGTGQLLLAGARAVAVLGLFAAFGTLLLRVTVPRGWLRQARDGEQSIRRLACGSLVLAAVGLLAWFGLQCAVLSGATSAGGTLSAVGVVLRETAFGRLSVVQLAFVAGAAFALRMGWSRSATVSAAVALALQAGHLHAWAMEPGPSVLLICEGLHVLAAGAWLGALPALALLIRAAPADAALALSRRFSLLGSAAVALIAASAAWQGWILSGGMAGFVGTAYGWMELVKLALFLLMLGCAAANRFRFTPRLAGPDAAARTTHKPSAVSAAMLRTSTRLLAAAVLTSLEPGMHVQPVWPFTRQPSLLVVQADPEFRREVADAVLALLGAVALVGLGLVVRWLRWVAWAVALAIAWLAVPHLDLLFVEAYPTSFYRSPTGFASASVAQGAALYPNHCATCHGVEGTGDGPAAKTLTLAPADLTADHLWAHSDGQMFWWLTHGIVSSEGEVAMPGFADKLSEDDRWALIDYVRSHNAGWTYRHTGSWSPPLRAPAFEARCADGRSVTLNELRGHAVRIAFGRTSGDPGGVTRIGVSLPGARATAACVTEDPAVPAAYAVVTGLDAPALNGAQLLVDANGWLRALIPAGVDPANEIGHIVAAPLPATIAAGHHHEG